MVFFHIIFPWHSQFTHYHLLRGACGVIVIVVGNGHSDTRVQILDEIDCISPSTNTLGKGMNPIILPPAMGK